MKIYDEFSCSKVGSIVRIHADRARVIKIERAFDCVRYLVECEDWGRAYFCFNENGEKISQNSFNVLTNGVFLKRGTSP